MRKQNRLAVARPNWLLAAMAVVTFTLAALAGSGLAYAHGERNQEPFLRMRTTHFYDVTFSVAENAVLNVNDEMTMTGKFRLFNFWPASVAAPGKVYMNAATNGAAFVKKESWVNQVPAIQSFDGELGRDYEYKVVLQARAPGPWHVHPMVNIESAGGLLGPGILVEVKGDMDDFVYPVTTLDGTQIANLATYGMTNVLTWHAVWVVIALSWLLWWIRRPLLIPRFLMSRTDDHEDELITRTDTVVAAGYVVLVIGLVFGSYFYANASYPDAIPLQTGTAFVEPLPVPATIPVRVKRSEYYVPGRTIVADLEITNDSNSPIQIGEFSSASLRFVNLAVPAAVASIPKGYPREYVPPKGLAVSDNSPIAPGETRVVKIDATDTAWETERLMGLLEDPDSALGGLLFFYDANNKRYMSEVYGPLVPVFQRNTANLEPRTQTASN